MKDNRSTWVVLMLIASFGLTSCRTIDRNVDTEWMTLFDGSDLTHWVVEEGGEWTIENGVLVGRHGINWSTNPETSGSWLRSKERYRDFELEFEYAINEGGNSGVFFRSKIERNPAFTGYEMQIVDYYGKDPTTYGATAIYDLLAPMKNNVKKAGEWNQVKIKAVGPSIQFTVNGEVVLQAVDYRAQEGYIGLQNHDSHAVVKFRNIRVRRL